jgi:hypothetical protein
VSKRDRVTIDPDEVGEIGDVLAAAPVAEPVVITEAGGMRLGDVVRFRFFPDKGEDVIADATIAKLHVDADGALASCDLDVHIPARVVDGVEVFAARTDRIKGIRRDAVADGVHEPFTWLPKGAEA